MKKRILQFRMTAVAVMIALLLGVIGIMKGYAWNHSNVSIDNLCYNLNDNTLTASVIGHIQGTSAVGELTIPSTVTYTDEENVTRTYSVTIIATSAFFNCYGFTSLSIPNSVKWIFDSAFSGCSGFTGSLNIPNSVYQIGEEAFSNCYGFDGTLIIGNSVSSIGYHAFVDCRNFSSMICFSNTPPTIEWNAFYRFPLTIPVSVPYGTINTYANASGWSEFTNYQEIAYKSLSGYAEDNGNWQFIASPLAENTDPTTVDNMITETTYDLYRFNQSAELEWQNYKAHTNDFTIANGQGYLYANQEDVNLIFKGTFNEGTLQDVGLTYDGTAQFAGWNLVGNPFPYPATVSRSCYVMNEDGTGLEPTPLSAGNTIAACTGIMVKADGENESITFSKATRQNAVNNGLLHIVVANEDKAIISFNEGDELAKYVFNKEKAQIYIPQGSEEYAIAFSDKQRTMPMNFKAVKNGEYTLSINPQNVELDYLHLIDNLTGADIDLLQTPDYTFTAKATDYASRFRLCFPSAGTQTATMMRLLPTSAMGKSFWWALVRTHAMCPYRLSTCMGVSLFRMADTRGVSLRREWLWACMSCASSMAMG